MSATPEPKDLFPVYFACCARVAADVHGLGRRSRIVYEPYLFMQWVRSKLLALGLRDAAANCDRGRTSEYAWWVAKELLVKAAGNEPNFALPSLLSKEDELDYWRAIAIAHELWRRNEY